MDSDQEVVNKEFSLCACGDPPQNGHKSEIPENGYMAERWRNDSVEALKYAARTWGLDIIIEAIHAQRVLTVHSKAIANTCEPELDPCLQFVQEWSRYARVSGGDSSL